MNLNLLGVGGAENDRRPGPGPEERPCAADHPLARKYCVATIRRNIRANAELRQTSERNFLSPTTQVRRLFGIGPATSTFALSKHTILN